MDFGQLADEATFGSAAEAAGVAASAGAAAAAAADWGGEPGGSAADWGATATDSAAASASAADLFGGQYDGDGAAFQPSHGTPAPGGADIEGMIDQTMAHLELSSRFEIVPDGTTGHAHNQVTQEEYDRIRKTYSDVRLGRGDLTIDASEMTDDKQRQDYQDAMLGNIADMMMTTSGRKQVMGLSNNVARDDAGAARLDPYGNEIHHSTTIRALYEDKNKDLDHTNDGHDPKDYETGYAATTPEVDTLANSDASYRQSDIARGAGTDTTIWMSPIGAGARVPDDVVLAHEMQHALHMTQGTRAAGRWDGPGPDYDTPNSERQAMGLDYYGANQHDPVGCSENTYRRERNTLGRGPALPLLPNYHETP